MTRSLDISLHGAGRVAVIERIAHCCRYTPGLLYLDGEAGKSPVNFLRDMVALLRDEVDVVLLQDDCSVLDRVIREILTQWRVYRDGEIGETDIQSIHHFLDVRAQYDQCALIVVERQLSLDDDSIDFLMSLMARHSRLTVLLSGVFDVRSLLRIANQYEIPVNSIELPDISGERPMLASQDDLFPGNAADARPERAIKSLDHTFSDTFVGDLSDDFLDEDVPLEASSDDALNAGFRDRVVRGPVSRYGVPLGGYGLLLLAVFVVALLLFISMRTPDRDHSSAAVTLSDEGASAPIPEMASPAATMPVDQPPPVIGGQASPGIARAPVVQEKTVQPDVVARTGVTGAGMTDGFDGSRPAPALAPEPGPVVGAEVAADARSAVAATPSPAVTKSGVASKVKAGQSPKPGVNWKGRPDHYTVQLASAHNVGNIQKLADALPSANPHYVYRTVRDGKPWFVLLYGSFPDRAAAEAARDSLGAGIKSGTTPWVRKQGEILGR